MSSSIGLGARRASSGKRGRYEVESEVEVQRGEFIGAGVDTDDNPVAVYTVGKAQQAIPVDALRALMCSGRVMAPADVVAGFVSEDVDRAKRGEDTDRLDALADAVADAIAERDAIRAAERARAEARAAVRAAAQPVPEPSPTAPEPAAPAPAAPTPEPSPEPTSSPAPAAKQGRKRS